MSPEVAKSAPYNAKADAFSFATILWQLCSHQRPFRGLDEARFVACVVRGGERPPLVRGWPPGLTALLSDCWHTEAALRPAFGEVVQRLRRLFAVGDELAEELEMASEFSPTLVTIGGSSETASVSSNDELLPHGVRGASSMSSVSL